MSMRGTDFFRRFGDFAQIPVDEHTIFDIAFPFSENHYVPGAQVAMENTNLASSTVS